MVLFFFGFDVFVVVFSGWDCLFYDCVLLNVDIVVVWMVILVGLVYGMFEWFVLLMMLNVVM